VAVSVAVASGGPGSEEVAGGLSSLDALIAAAFGSGAEAGSYEENLLISQAVGEVRKGVADLDSAAPEEPAPADGGAPARDCPVCMESWANEGGGGGGDVGDGGGGGGGGRSDTLHWRRTARCGHLFCAPCAERWFLLSVLCPICKADVSEGAGGYVMRDDDGSPLA
jgi:hypothetical protein